MAAPKPRAGPAAGRSASARTAHRRLAAAGLAGLLEHLGNEALALAFARFFGALGRTRKSSSRRSVMAALPASSGVSGVRSTRTCLHWRGPRAPRGTAAKPLRAAPPHVQTGFRRGRCRVLLSCLPPLPSLSLRASAARRRCCASSQRAGERANGRRPGAFEARRLHVGRLRRRQREVRCECTRTARATTRRRSQNDMPDGTMRARQSAANRRPSWACLQPDRMRNADHGGCADRPK
jgi:hypothetical protein